MLPVSAVQGIWLRRIATRLPGAPGEREGAVGSGPQLQLLAIGDSIIDGVGIGHIHDSLPVQLARALAKTGNHQVRWKVEGETGRDIVAVLESLNFISDHLRPDFVLISVGVNDVTGLSSTRHWRRKLQALLQQIERRWPHARVLFAGLPPMSLFPLPPQPLRFTLGLRAARLDRIAQETIKAFPNASHIPTRINPGEHDFCEDGFHPSAESCTLWAKALAEIESRSEPA